MPPPDPEANRLSARAARFARVGVNVGGVAARMAGARLFGGGDGNAASLASALGGLKGPIMKVAQLMATIPDVLPPAYAEELQKLQSDAPPMGAAFVKRRMMAELGPDWLTRFKSFDYKPAAAASLGQVHRARLHDGRGVACKLQYPDMASAVEADLGQLRLLLGLVKSMDGALDSSEAILEIADRLREELDYVRELKHMRLFAQMLAHDPRIAMPEPIEGLSTKRLITMTWLDGAGLMSWIDANQDIRNRIADLIFAAWWGPMTHFGVIHGDPHLGNYTLTENAAQLNLMDFGCVRIFPPKFVAGVVQLYRALLAQDRDGIAAAYESWGFKNLNNDLIDALTIWARFIYGPLLDERERTIADDVSPAEYGRRELMEVRKRLKTLGPVLVPREFVFMDRAALGLGAAFLHLKARRNFARMFQASIADFSQSALAARQAAQLAQAGLATS